MNTLKRILRDETGDIEDLPALTILIVGIILPMLGVVLFAGRFGLASNSVQSAASAAARDASLSRTAADAVPHAQAAAVAALSGTVNCSALDTDIQADGLNTALGQTGAVSATITCTIDNSDLLFALIPGSTTITKNATSPIDPYRER